MIDVYNSKNLNFWYNLLDNNCDVIIINDMFFSVLGSNSIKINDYNELIKLMFEYFDRDFYNINLCINKKYGKSIYDQKLINLGEYRKSNYQ